MPLLEWLANTYKTFGASLEIVTDRSNEGAQFVKGFGGIGGRKKFAYQLCSSCQPCFCYLGLLRYRVEFVIHEMEDGIADFDLDEY